jgi:hypothetical protein
VLLDSSMGGDKRTRGPAERPQMGTLFAIETANTVVLAIVSALRPGGVISQCSALSFDFALWSEGQVPVTLVLRGGSPLRALQHEPRL